MNTKPSRTLMIAVLAIGFAAVSTGTMAQAMSEPHSSNDLRTAEEDHKTRECTVENSIKKDNEKDKSSEDNSAFNPCYFSSEIDNQYFPMSKYAGKTLRFAGTTIQDGNTVQIVKEWQVQGKTAEIDGVMTTPVLVTEYEDDQVVEIATDFYAQGNNGVVYLFGEYSTDYEDGKPTGHEGSWFVGDDTPVPGIMMPSNPGLGIEFSFMVEDVPGAVHEKGIISNTNAPISVKFGSYDNALAARLYDFNDGNYKTNYFVPAIGLVKTVSEDTSVELVSIS